MKYISILIFLVNISLVAHSQGLKGYNLGDSVQGRPMSINTTIAQIPVRIGCLLFNGRIVSVSALKEPYGAVGSVYEVESIIKALENKYHIKFQYSPSKTNRGEDKSGIYSCIKDGVKYEAELYNYNAFSPGKYQWTISIINIKGYAEFNWRQDKREKERMLNDI